MKTAVFILRYFYDNSKDEKTMMASIHFMSATQDAALKHEQNKEVTVSGNGRWLQNLMDNILE